MNWNKAIKILLWSVGITGVVCLVAFLLLIRMSNILQLPTNVAAIAINIDEELDSLVSFELQICDSLRTFFIEDYADGISENIGISDAIKPCDVIFIYYFDASSKAIKADPFNCHGCDGHNSYTLFNDSVVYHFHP